MTYMERKGGREGRWIPHLYLAYIFSLDTIWSRMFRINFHHVLCPFYSVLFVCNLLMQFVVGLGDKVSPTDIEEGMRVG